MKLGIISDIHLDTNEDYPVMDVLSDKLHEENCNGLILAGDISDTAVNTFKMVDDIRKKLGMPLWFVPGNHDMWDPDHKFNDTWEIYNEYRQMNDCLCGKTVEVGDLGILTGSLGWYDYSFADNEKFTLEDFQRKNNYGRTWQDSRFVRWNKDDITVCNEMLDEMKAPIAENQGKRITAVTHMLGIPEFSVVPPVDIWDYFNAFLGSSVYGDYYEKNGVDCAIMGHVHHRQKIVKNGVDYRCACLGYHTEWTTKDTVKEVTESLQYLEK